MSGVSLPARLLATCSEMPLAACLIQEGRHRLADHNLALVIWIDWVTWVSITAFLPQRDTYRNLGCSHVALPYFGSDSVDMHHAASGSSLIAKLDRSSKQRGIPDVSQVDE